MTVWVNGVRREVAPGTTLAALLAELFPARQAGPGVPGVAAALNATVVPRGRWPGTVLAEGDRVEVLTAVQGG